MPAAEVLADRGYDSDAYRAALEIKGIARPAFRAQNSQGPAQLRPQALQGPPSHREHGQSPHFAYLNTRFLHLHSGHFKREKERGNAAFVDDVVFIIIRSPGLPTGDVVLGRSLQMNGAEAGAALQAARQCLHLRNFNQSAVRKHEAEDGKPNEHRHTGPGADMKAGNRTIVLDLQGFAMNEPVLVIGGAGFIGSHACKELAKAGYLPIAFDNLSRGHRHNVKWGPFFQGDTRCSAEIEEAIIRYRPIACMQFAALAYVEESFERPIDYFDNNVGGVIASMQAILRHRVPNYVFSSSCAVYGRPERLPLNEASSLVPISPYGRSKLMAERVVQDCLSGTGLRYMCLRYFNACGADPEGELYEEHNPETHIVPRCILAAMDKIDDFTIYGANHPTSDGTCVRDYVHVKDIALAHVLALEGLRTGSEAKVLNIGSGNGNSIKQLLKEVEMVVGHPVPVIYGQRRNGDPAELYADIELAQKEIGFTPQHSSLNFIVSTAYKGISRHINKV